MEIVNGDQKAKMKSITVEDVAHGTNPNQVFFQSGEIEKVPNTVFTKDAELMTQAQVSDSELRVQYNTAITTLNPEYAKLQPLNSYIIRMKVLEDEVKKIGDSKLILPKTSFARKQTNAGTIGDKISDPFRFTGVAVVVAIPEHETQLKPGMLVHIVKPRVIVDNESVLGYTDEYVHPDYNDTRVPQLVQDPDFGYAIISRQQIKVII